MIYHLSQEKICTSTSEICEAVILFFSMAKINFLKIFESSGTKEGHQNDEKISKNVEFSLFEVI